MNTEEVLEEFRRAGALLENGHFVLSSGRRSAFFLHKAQVFSDPKVTEKLCHALAQKLSAQFGQIDSVCGPAIGGIIPAYETARALGCRAFYTERDENDAMHLKRFTPEPGERIVIVEDIVTTGKSINETIKVLQNTEAKLLGGACVVKRSKETQKIELPLVSLAEVEFPDYSADDLPPEIAAREPVKPGSRRIFTA